MHVFYTGTWRIAINCLVVSRIAIQLMLRRKNIILYFGSFMAIAIKICYLAVVNQKALRDISSSWCTLGIYSVWQSHDAGFDTLEKCSDVYNWCIYHCNQNFYTYGIISRFSSLQHADPTKYFADLNFFHR